MYERINFLRERVRLQEEVLQSDKRLAFFTSIGLGIFMLVFVGVIGYRFYLGSQIEVVEAASQQATTRLTSLTSVQNAYMQRKNMLGLTKQVIEKRTKAWEAISYLYLVIPTDSRIETINLSGTDGSLEFTVRAPSIFAYKNLSTILQSEEVAKSGYRPQLGTLERAKNGSYSLQVRLYMQKTPESTADTQATMSAELEEL